MQADLGLLDGLLGDNPQRQVLGVDKPLFLGKFATIAAAGRRSATPDEELFNRFRASLPALSANPTSINQMVRRFDWARWEGTNVARRTWRAGEDCDEGQGHRGELVSAGCFTRGDYKYAAEFILLYLSVNIRTDRKFVFPDLAKASNARFIQRSQYFVLMELLMDVPAVQALYSPREQETITDMALFSWPWWTRGWGWRRGRTPAPRKLKLPGNHPRLDGNCLPIFSQNFALYYTIFTKLTSFKKQFIFFLNF